MQLFVDNLTNVDFSYLDHSRGLVGETWLASILLSGDLDQTSMLWDFGVVKKALRNWLDDQLDHRLLVPTESEHLSYAIENGEIVLTWQLVNGDTIRMAAPEQAVALVESDHIDAESAAEWSMQRLQDQFPSNLSDIELRFEPESIDGAFYHYSHGLKKHDGNCQRIAHGHRSRIEIRRNGKRDDGLERDWAEQWRDIYLISKEDLCSEQPEDSTWHSAYDASQGHFTLSMPRTACYLIPVDTTVECIAQHIAKQLKNRFPADDIEVKAFEGLNKGAIFRCPSAH